MYPISSSTKALYEAEQKKVLRITGTDKNGTVINITEANVALDSFSIDRFCCVGQKLEIGTACSSEMDFTLDNPSGVFNNIVFEGTELFVEVGIANWNSATPSIQYMPCGYFTPDEQPRKRYEIRIKALDRMARFDSAIPTLTPWTDNNGNLMTDNNGNVLYLAAELSFPCTVEQLVKQCCMRCLVPFSQNISSLPNSNYTISAFPKLQQDFTFRSVIQWCAGLMGTCAFIDWNGNLVFKWYSSASYSSTPANRYESDLQENDITITGVEYTNTKNATIVSGSNGYTLDMTGNYLVGTNPATVLPPVKNSVNGFTYRPFTAEVVNAPYLWPLDIITFTDGEGNNHNCAITNVNFTLNGTTVLEGKGMTIEANSDDSDSGVTKEQGLLIEQAVEVTRELDDSLNQDEIFNRLTNNGAAQGIILYDGNLYVNASYINTGFLSADRIGANSIAVSKLTGNISNNGWVLDLDNGTLTLGNLSANNINAGTLSADRIGANSIAVSKLTGSISATATGGTTAWSIDLTNGTLTIGDINANSIKAGTMSADRISGGTLTLGGNNNTSGILTVKNASGTTIGTWNNSGISINSGSINLNNGVFEVTSSGALTAKNATLNGAIQSSGTDIYGNPVNVRIAQGRLRIFGSTNDGDTQQYQPNAYLVLRGLRQGSGDTGNIIANIYSSSAELDISCDGMGANGGGKLRLSALGSLAGSSTHSIIQIGTENTVGYTDTLINAYGVCTVNGSLGVTGNFSVTGTKNRLVETEQYSRRYLYCYETPTPMFGDVGEGIISEDGLCYVWLDPVFAQTIATNHYQVFLQRYGEGDCWVGERRSGCFIVHGTPGLTFGWEIKAKQRDYDQLRLERDAEHFIVPTQTYGIDAAKHIDEIRKEREAA